MLRIFETTSGKFYQSLVSAMITCDLLKGPPLHGCFRAITNSFIQRYIFLPAALDRRYVNLQILIVEILQKIKCL
jgi:hypothetical protein